MNPDEDVMTWWARHNAELDAECKYSAGDRVIISEEVIDQMEFLPDVHAALVNGTRIGSIGNRTKSRYNGDKEPRYEVILDDCPMGNVQYSESELSLAYPIEVVTLDIAIRNAEENLERLRSARHKIVERFNKQ
jgi:hypothetical protein